LSATKLILAAAALLVAGAAGAETSGDPAKGQAVFEDRCTLCHAPGGGQGPSLKGVVGRKAGSLPGFAYSAALAGSGILWSEASLNAFLSDPAKLVPGTAMRVIVPDGDERRDLVAYLASLRP
jgi:cytochrome c2